MQPATAGAGILRGLRAERAEVIALFRWITKKLARLASPGGMQMSRPAARSGRPAQGEFPRAEANHASAIGLLPEDAAAHFMRGNALVAQGLREEAIASYRVALRLRPEFPEALSNLGNALKEQGRLQEATACYENAIRLRPGIMEAHFNLGFAFQAMGDFARAIPCFEAAAGLRPDLPEVQYSLGYLYYNADRREEALACFRKALAQSPDHAEARWGYALSQLLAVCGPGDDPERGRAAFAAELDSLARWFDGTRLASAATLVGSIQPFRLAYHEENNRDLMQQYGRLCARLMNHWAQQLALPPPGERSPGKLIRVAVVSRYFGNHSVWNAITKGWFQKLDRRRFVLEAFCLGPEADPETHFARARAAHFEQGSRTLRQWVDAITDRRPDVVIYPELGMDPMTLRLASLRLAPVQLASWGHPETSGLPTIDHYLSAEDFEPPGAQDHYTEQLVPLPRLGCYLEPAGIAAEDPDLEKLGIDPGVPILVCPGTPFKYAPAHDSVLTRIAARLRSCQFVFFSYRLHELSQRLRLRLEAQFRREGIDPRAHLRFIPWLSPPAFHGLMQRADVYLDTIGFSGFNTAIQALECGLPIVAREGRFMRGRFGSAILLRLGVPELVARTDEAYIAIAEKLILDRPFAENVRARIVSRRAALFNDLAPIHALERFLGRATQGSDSRVAHAERLITEGRHAESEGRLTAACEHFREAAAVAPRHAAAHLNLGIALGASGDSDGACAAYEAGLGIDPSDPYLNYNLGNLLSARGDLARAEQLLLRSLEARPDFAEAHVALSNVLDAMGRTAAAADALEEALRCRPEYAGALFNYGVILRKLERGDEAVDALRHALVLEPQNQRALDALSAVLREQGFAQESQAPLAAAIELAAGRFDLESRALFALNFDETLPAEEICARHCDFGARLERAFPARFAGFHGTPDPARRLRIGYVSGDFRLHPVAQFALVPLERHDRSAFEVCCYATSPTADPITERLRAAADRWTNAAAMSDEQLADAIHRDAIDILVDLSGHTSMFRLAMFAQQPAPVQVAWLGYLNTTGLTRMHYRLCDARTDPPGISDALHTEALIRLPHSQWCYRPYQLPDAAAAAPCTTNGYVTFGSFNHAMKISPTMCGRWAQILSCLPDSRLVFVGVSSTHKKVALLDEMTRAGIAAERLTVIPHVRLDEYARWFNRVDIALDTLPYGGGTTTFDALWMGVPVVSALGETPVSRSAASILAILGLDEWVAPAASDYARVAVERASDQAAIAMLRQSLRATMQMSPLMDEPVFVRDLESAYRGMWQNWCTASARR